ncbi:globin [Photobacterium sp.]|uniref:globin n=1 Tax=Photobacterium sp. TaxID=660 RepID=UPI00299ECAE0|nr:globin [Photobacterium sp.]
MEFHERYNDSYARCLRNPRFLTIFYDIFCSRNDKFQLMFANVDMGRQIKMLKASLIIIMLANTSGEARESVRKFGKRHGPEGLGVNPMDFDIWFDCLLSAVQICDPLYDDEVKQAWHACFNEGMEIMKKECRVDASI